MSLDDHPGAAKRAGRSSVLNRWTKYAKRGFYFEKKQISDNETLRTHAARISRKATSVALKCSVSKRTS